MKIGELARAAGCQVETVRYYEREGLLPAPSRSEANYRQYGPAHVERLRFIRHCRSLDMAQAEIRSLLQAMDAPESTCESVNAAIDRQIVQVQRRIAELRALESQLHELRSTCGTPRAASACGILRGLSS
jgi:Cd(II)/Pb(II)-responsive transcriptional regulator